MSNRLNPLPVDALKKDLLAGIADVPNFVLTAPTGSGKSTRVPRFLLEAFPLGGDILVLQPRRLPARALARRLAYEMEESVGETVGFQVRLDRTGSEKTRIWFITEGIFVQRALRDPGLKGVAAVILDEFHERHLDADMALGLACLAQRRNRPDLTIGIMSATLEPEPLARFLGKAKIWKTEGRRYPVDIGYQRPKAQEAPWDQAVRAIENLTAGKQPSGDFLVFMPSVLAIRKTLQSLEEKRLGKDYRLLPLHGELPPDAQDEAIDPSNRAKIIVSTNVAETSLTIPGVRTVIDSGLARIPVYDPNRGINSILDQKISRASADQRAGRAGREAPGIAIRLWEEADQGIRLAQTPPEIERLDLAETVLQLHVRGHLDPHRFPWVTPPPKDSLARAERQLEDLGALEKKNGLLVVTEIGKALADMPMSPRHGRILLAAQAYGCLASGKILIAIAQGRNLMLPLRDSRADDRRESLIGEQGDPQSDWIREFLAWSYAQRVQFRAEELHPLGIHRYAAIESARLAESWSFSVPALPHPPPSDEDLFSRLRNAIFFGFADQLARRRDRGTLRVALIHDRGGEISKYSDVQNAPWIVATELEERRVRNQVTTLLKAVTAVDADWLERAFPNDFQTRLSTQWESSARRVQGTEERCFRDLVLESKESNAIDPQAASNLLAKKVAEGELILKKWTPVVSNWIQRFNCLAKHYPEHELQSIDDEVQLLLLEQICEGATRYKEIKDREVFPVIKSWIPTGFDSFMETTVPERFQLPGRFKPKLRYEADGTVVLPAKIQDLYDVPGASLTVCEGRCKLRLEILAPNQRPVQITDDLDGFWSQQYPSIRKELFGRYPKHEWR